MDRFGCAHCWPETPDAAMTAILALPIQVRLVDESHFIVLLRECPVCSQQFLSVFSELVDWMGGDDSQFRTFLPVTKAEVEEMMRLGGLLAEKYLYGVGMDRKSLWYEHPKGEPSRVDWGRGIRFIAHD